MARYRIKHIYPYYYGCIPIDIWVVQVLREGMFISKWVDIKGFDTYKRIIKCTTVAHHKRGVVNDSSSCFAGRGWRYPTLDILCGVAGQPRVRLCFLR